MPQTADALRVDGPLTGRNFSTSDSYTAKEIEKGKFLGEPQGDTILVRIEGDGQMVRSFTKMGLLPTRYENGRPIYSASQSTAVF